MLDLQSSSNLDSLIENAIEEAKSKNDRAKVIAAREMKERREENLNSPERVRISDAAEPGADHKTWKSRLSEKDPAYRRLKGMAENLASKFKPRGIFNNLSKELRNNLKAMAENLPGQLNPGRIFNKLSKDLRINAGILDRGEDIDLSLYEVFEKAQKRLRNKAEKVYRHLENGGGYASLEEFRSDYGSAMLLSPSLLVNKVLDDVEITSTQPPWHHPFAEVKHLNHILHPECDYEESMEVARTEVAQIDTQHSEDDTPSELFPSYEEKGWLPGERMGEDLNFLKFDIKRRYRDYE